MNRRGFALAALAAIASAEAPIALAASPPENWDGLVRVKSKKMRYVYLLPGADFRPYSKVILDPTEMAFKKNWQREFNSTTVRSLSGRITDQDIENMVSQGGKTAGEIFAQSFNKGGFQVVSQPGDDVLRVRTAVVNITLTAPPRMTSGRSRTYAGHAGTATLVIEARDSVSNALLGRAVDPQVAGDTEIFLNRTDMSNRADFRALAQRWADHTVDGLQQLKSLSPVAG